MKTDDDADALQKIFESFGIRVRVRDDEDESEMSETMGGAAGNDADEDDDRNPNDEEGESKKEKGALAVFRGTCGDEEGYPAEVQAVNKILSDEENSEALIKFLERTENQQVSSWGVFSFAVLLFKTYLGNKRTSQVFDAVLRDKEIKRTVDMISKLPDEFGDQLMVQYIRDEVSDQRQRRVNSQIASNIKIYVLIVLFIMFIFFVHKALPIAGDLLDVGKLSSETVKDTAETAKEYVDTGNRGLRNANLFINYLGDKFWDIFQKDKIGSEKQKMFIGSGQSEDEKGCFLDFLNKTYEFVDEEIRLLNLSRWKDHKGLTKTHRGKSYNFKHAYHSSTGEENAAAEAFLDALNAWNNLSDNNHLTDVECKKKTDDCHRSDPVSVGKVNEAVDRDEDLFRVKQMSNVSVAYGQGGDKPSVVHWEPPDELNATDVTDGIDETMRSAALASIRARYVELKNTKKWTGWYYLLTLATALKTKQDQRLLKFYEVTDSGGDVATVPVMRHAPELTVKHTSGTGHAEDIEGKNQLSALMTRPPFSAYSKTTESRGVHESSQLLLESFDRDVYLIPRPTREERRR